MKHPKKWTPTELRVKGKFINVLFFADGATLDAALILLLAFLIAPSPFKLQTQLTSIPSNF